MKGVSPLFRGSVVVIYSTRRRDRDRTLVGVVLPLCRDEVSAEDIRWKSLTPIQRCSWCILHDWARGHSLEESYSYTEMQLVHSTASADWARGHSLEESNSYTEMQLVYSTALWARGHSLEESYSYTEMHILQCLPTGPEHIRWKSLTPIQRCSWCILQPLPTGPEDIRWKSLTPIQRCSWCILQPLPTGPEDIRWKSLTPIQRCSWCAFYSLCRLGQRTFVRRVLHLFLHRDAVGVFYSV